ncbi:FadR/GntR family transcriptional regulator [Shewanella sp. 1_MG-2023]|uniref:FadR family transcriptional regulator n=1 Tax=Shewanella electrodiphila TaxID=934143 RepID=A0ABT0KSF4_9GAMM|nr:MULTISPECIES: FadR/GntR family transcriptional regulator [Shewanella]MCC4831598.1 FadR family transcriptional regulator [Shewanella sp. 10N.7]MCL1046688.1 FadR family transcriptional regulator [Shewanella electrodiphila]MDO6611175.1 FadR/GntR family transcriptional regulator [Shewanella sp. 7_MG-2023]MDO6770948.1 FadR/GntR family transcriptional regulator [Shewanella sp. 2_MG-2023]MDO6794665.1 FadR/GntR family transcriptional regulator [Shewanella sp. 1_MG-2023]
MFIQVEDSSRRVHVQVARQIARKILSGEIEPLQRLPCEMDLCEMFGVSRTALRESTKLLSAKGLIESRPKVGTTVRARANWHFLDPQLLDWIQGLENTEVFLSKFLGLRKAIEPEACALAASYATIEQRKQMSVLMQNMIKAAEEFDYEQWTINDHLFHQTIYLSTDNQFYIPFGNILTTIFKLFIDHSAEGGRFCINEHKGIYDSIMSGDADQARSYCQELLRDDNQRFSEVPTA